MVPGSGLYPVPPGRALIHHLLAGQCRPRLRSHPAFPANQSSGVPANRRLSYAHHASVTFRVTAHGGIPSPSAAGNHSPHSKQCGPPCCRRSQDVSVDRGPILCSPRAGDLPRDRTRGHLISVRCRESFAAQRAVRTTLLPPIFGRPRRPKTLLCSPRPGELPRDRTRGHPVSVRCREPFAAQRAVRTTLLTLAPAFPKIPARFLLAMGPKCL